jgi:hypothetical protein
MMIAALPGEGDPGDIGLAGPAPTLPPHLLANIGHDDSDIDPQERPLPAPPRSSPAGRLAMVAVEPSLSRAR